MSRWILVVMIAGLPAICLGALYSPTETSLDADTGKASWEGPDDQLDLTSQNGTHSVNSDYSYFSGWSESTVNSSADASAMLCADLITLSASTTTNGYGYNHTQGSGSASVSFDLPGGEFLSLNDSFIYTDSSQVSWSLMGPDGWAWTAPLGSSILAPAGAYTFSISSSVERMTGIDFASSQNASLQFTPEPAGSAVIPEPAAIALLPILSLSFLRKKKQKPRMDTNVHE